MKIHTNKITAEDLWKARYAVNPLLDLSCIKRGSRSHGHAFEFRLAYLGEKEVGDGRRKTNTGTHGASDILSATYDEHGEFFALLFDIDPDAVIGPYCNRIDFHQQTDNQYRVDINEQAAAEYGRLAQTV